ncbi:MAG: DUF4900 domain-containing protein [Candidatus Omnitrophica bacterium]|nr:DUF4900 domain-containing protein [Candidatus Omnitrophota bacterium]
MNTVYGRWTKERGFTLLTLSILTPVLFILGGSLIVFSLTEVRATHRSQMGTQAFYLAESAVDSGYRWLQDQGGPPGGTEALVLDGGWQEMGLGEYLVVVDPDDGNPLDYVKRYAIQGWGVMDDGSAARRTTMLVQVESFARYAYFTNNEISSSNQIVWFTSWDHITGPAHTNGQFSMWGSPTFDGFVSSVSSSINYYNPPPAGGNNPHFNQGYELGSDVKPYPTSIPTTLINAANTAGMVFTGDTTVTLVSDGTMRVTNTNAGLSNAVVSLPDNGVLYVQNGNVNLSGTLQGQLTVATNQNIRITNSVVYSDDPQVDPDSQDLLGILAGGNVVVASSAPNNIRIDASVMALNTSFTVENWWQGPAKGTLTLVGGITQSKRGPVGSFNASTGTFVSGYKKDYRYDERLRNMIPPYFPLTGDYVILGWEEELDAPSE